MGHGTVCVEGVTQWQVLSAEHLLVGHAVPRVLFWLGGLQHGGWGCTYTHLMFVCTSVLVLLVSRLVGEAPGLGWIWRFDVLVVFGEEFRMISLGVLTLSLSLARSMHMHQVLRPSACLECDRW